MYLLHWKHISVHIYVRYTLFIDEKYEAKITGPQLKQIICFHHVIYTASECNDSRGEIFACSLVQETEDNQMLKWDRSVLWKQQHLTHRLGFRGLRWMGVMGRRGGWGESAKPAMYSPPPPRKLMEKTQLKVKFTSWRLNLKLQWATTDIFLGKKISIKNFSLYLF